MILLIVVVSTSTEKLVLHLITIIFTYNQMYNILGAPVKVIFFLCLHRLHQSTQIIFQNGMLLLKVTEMQQYQNGVKKHG